MGIDAAMFYIEALEDKIDRLADQNKELSNSKYKLRDLVREQAKKIKKLEEWQEKAFEAHSNIDIDIEHLDD